jgi:Domain of unknown function (DUF4328)
MGMIFCPVDLKNIQESPNLLAHFKSNLMRLEPLRSNDIPAKLTMAVTGLLLLTYVIITVLMLTVYVMLENGDTDGLEGIANLLIGSGTFNMIVYVALIVCFLIWFSRAYHNIKRLGKLPNHDIGWSIGGWFVPILWWFRPWEIYREIGETYTTITKAFPQHLRPDTPNRGQLLGLGGWWWGTWVGIGLVARIVDRAAERADDFEWWLLFPSIGMMIPTVLLFFGGAPHQQDRIGRASHLVQRRLPGLYRGT